MVSLKSPISPSSTRSWTRQSNALRRSNASSWRQSRKNADASKGGYFQSQLIRFKDSLGQKLGGWQKLYANAVAGTPRDLHAWQDLNGTKHLAVGTTTQL